MEQDLDPTPTEKGVLRLLGGGCSLGEKKAADLTQRSQVCFPGSDRPGPPPAACGIRHQAPRPGSHPDNPLSSSVSLLS